MTEKFLILQAKTDLPRRLTAGLLLLNPLLPGHLTPYADHTQPEVESIELRANDEAAATMPNFVRGSVQLYAEAYDRPALPVPGQWNGMPITPAVVSYRIETWNGKVKIPEICSNVVFGGPKRNTLYVTATNSLYGVMLHVNGHKTF